VQEGSRQLLAGIAAAFEVRGLIQQALGAIMARHQVAADTAYLMLQVRAAERGATLPATAAHVVQEQDA
jgi:AmiR/NasT family two-component response regulator